MTKKQKRMIEDLSLLQNNVVRGVACKEKNVVCIELNSGHRVTVEERQDGSYWNQNLNSIIATAEQILYVRHRQIVKARCGNGKYN